MVRAYKNLLSWPVELLFAFSRCYAYAFMTGVFFVVFVLALSKVDILFYASDGINIP